MREAFLRRCVRERRERAALRSAGKGARKGAGKKRAPMQETRLRPAARSGIGSCAAGRGIRTFSVLLPRAASFPPPRGGRGAGPCLRGTWAARP